MRIAQGARRVQFVVFEPEGCRVGRGGIGVQGFDRARSHDERRLTGREPVGVGGAIQRGVWCGVKLHGACVKL